MTNFQIKRLEDLIDLFAKGALNDSNRDDFVMLAREALHEARCELLRRMVATMPLRRRRRLIDFNEFKWRAYARANHLQEFVNNSPGSLQ